MLGGPAAEELCHGLREGDIAEAGSEIALALRGPAVEGVEEREGGRGWRVLLGGQVGLEPDGLGICGGLALPGEVAVEVCEREVKTVKVERLLEVFGPCRVVEADAEQGVLELGAGGRTVEDLAGWCDVLGPQAEGLEVAGEELGDGSGGETIEDGRGKGWDGLDGVVCRRGEGLRPGLECQKQVGMGEPGNLEEVLTDAGRGGPPVGQGVGKAAVRLEGARELFGELHGWHGGGLAQMVSRTSWSAWLMRWISSACSG